MKSTLSITVLKSYVCIIEWFLKGHFNEDIPNFANAEPVRLCTSVFIAPQYSAVVPCYEDRKEEQNKHVFK